MEMELFNLPALTSPDKTSFSLKERHVSSWCNDLPLGHPQETQQLVLTALRQSNQQRWPWNDRLAFLEKVREPINIPLVALENSLKSVEFPIGERHAKMAQDLRSLCSEICTAYRLTLHDYQQRHAFFRRKKVTALIASRAIRYASLINLNSHQLYGTPPNGHWRIVHNLYSYAEALDVHNIPIEDNIRSSMRDTTITQIYKQILLIATASTSRLAQKEIIVLFSILKDMGQLLDLTPCQDNLVDNASFLVDREQDKGPAYLELQNSSFNPGTTLLMDTRRLIAYLQYSATRQESILCDISDLNTLSADLYQRLEISWKKLPNRGRRMSSDVSNPEYVEIISGLTNIHKQTLQLTGDKLMSTGKSAQFKAAAVSPDDPEARIVDFWDQSSSETMRYMIDKNDFSGVDRKQNSDIFTHSFEIAEENKLGGKEDEVINSSQWQILDESAGGFRIVSSAASESTINVGELVKVRKNGQESYELIGVIRWINCHGKGSVEAGVRVITPEVTPIVLKRIDKQGKGGQPRRSLILNYHHQNQQVETLLAPITIFNSGDQALVSHHSGQEYIELGEKLNRGSGENFSLFRFSRKEIKQGNFRRKQEDK
ncbi:MAG: hypothetical protein HQL49_01925 [Gammaproteobacteria bacterium]|nr:hypothetical protein [Gammaproteobacteria bacterium]